MKIINLIVVLIAFSQCLGAQNKTALLYKNITLHLGNGQVIENGMLGVEDGKIIAVEAWNPEKAKAFSTIIDGEKQHIYPGIIALNTRLGLEEVEAVRATKDFREVGRFNPSIRAVIAYNTDSKVTPTVRSNGVLLTQVVPEGGRISGQSSLLYTDGFNWEDAAFEMDNAVHLHWPNQVRYTGWWAQKGQTQANKHYSRDVRAVLVYFDAAKAYAKKAKPATKNLKFEAMKAVFEGNKKLVVHVDEAQGMQDAVTLLKPYGASIILQGASDAWQVADFLKKENIPVVLKNVHSLPKRDDDAIDQPYKTPALLAEKGVLFALSMEGSWNVRNLPFQAGQAVAYGLDKELALQSITLNAAKIMGIDKRTGSLELGKDATFIVSLGDLLDMRTSQVTAAFIEGKKVDLGDKQKDLYEKYMKRYNIEE